MPNRLKEIFRALNERFDIVADEPADCNDAANYGWLADQIARVSKKHPVDVVRILNEPAFLDLDLNDLNNLPEILRRYCKRIDLRTTLYIDSSPPLHMQR